MCDDWDDDWENADINLITNRINNVKNNYEDEEEIDYANYSNINLSKDEKKILERKLVEDSDILLSKDLFGTNKLENKNSKENTNFLLKTKQDHENFAKTCIEKLKKSTPLHTKIFYQSLTNNIVNKFSCEEVKSIIFQLENIVVEKSENITKKPEIKKKSNKNYDDIFGRSENTDVYDEMYGSIADKF
jgi:hypothetical protein